VHHPALLVSASLRCHLSHILANRPIKPPGQIRRIYPLRVSMSLSDLIEPEDPLNLHWATEVCTKLSQLSLQPDSDLSVSRVTVNVTTFLRLHSYWEQERDSLSSVPKQAALTHYGLLRGVAGGLIEDLEKLVDDVLSWQRLPRKTRGAVTLAEKVKKSFDTPRVKTILSSLQYIEATINLIIEVWKYGRRVDSRTPTEEDFQRRGRTRRLIRSLVMNRKVALKYVNQRLAEEDATLLNTTRSTIDSSDSDKSSRPVLLSRRSVHAEQLAYLDEVLESGDDSRESIQRQDQLVHNLQERWTQSQVSAIESRDEESVFESDEEAATGGYAGGNASSYKAQPIQNRDLDHASSQRGQAALRAISGEPTLGRQRTNSGHAGQQPSLSLNTSIPIQQSTASARVASAKPPLTSTSTSHNANTGPPYSATTAKSHHTRAFSMSQAEQNPDALPQQKFKVTRDSGYGTENITGTIIEDSDDEDVKVYWQIAIGRKIYPYENSKLTDTSDAEQVDFENYLLSHDNAVTEIPTSTVIEAALRKENKYLFQRIPARGRFCEMWRIQTALKYNVSVNKTSDREDVLTSPSLKFVSLSNTRRLY